VGEEMLAMTVEPLILMFPEMRADNPPERQHCVKDLQIRRHRTDIGSGRLTPGQGFDRHFGNSPLARSALRNMDRVGSIDRMEGRSMHVRRSVFSSL
jgi:hypothetical protein